MKTKISIFICVILGFVFLYAISPKLICGNYGKNNCENYICTKFFLDEINEGFSNGKIEFSKINEFNFVFHVVGKRDAWGNLIFVKLNNNGEVDFYSKGNIDSIEDSYIFQKKDNKNYCKNNH